MPLPHGIPAHDTFGRIFAWLDPQKFMHGFSRWVQALQERLPVANSPEHPIRAIDGKQCRRSHDRLKGHGRREHRRATIITDVATVTWIQDQHHWPGLKAIGCIEAERHLSSGEVAHETRYYLSSASLTASQFQRAVRLHWGIENQVHWVLDMAFQEDSSRVRVGHGAENLRLLRRLSLNVLRVDTSTKTGVKARRKKAGWDLTYLHHLLSLLNEVAVSMFPLS